MEFKKENDDQANLIDYKEKAIEIGILFLNVFGL